MAESRGILRDILMLVLGAVLTGMSYSFFSDWIGEQWFEIWYCGKDHRPAGCWVGPDEGTEAPTNNCPTCESLNCRDAPQSYAGGYCVTVSPTRGIPDCGRSRHPGFYSGQPTEWMGRTYVCKGGLWVPP